jgi:hypothetical protein
LESVANATTEVCVRRTVKGICFVIVTMRIIIGPRSGAVCITMVDNWMKEIVVFLVKTTIIAPGRAPVTPLDSSVYVTTRCIAFLKTVVSIITLLNLWNPVSSAPLVMFTSIAIGRVNAMLWG